MVKIIQNTFASAAPYASAKQILIFRVIEEKDSWNPVAWCLMKSGPMLYAHPF